MNGAKLDNIEFGSSVEAYDIEFGTVDVRSIRMALSMTQSEFASTFGLSIGSIRNWEQERTEPDASIRSYIAVIRHNPDAVIDALEKERQGRCVRNITSSS